MSTPPLAPDTIAGRIRLFFTFADSRWEDLERGSWVQTVYRDFSAGLIVAMTAIPMAMGFAIAMGMRPEHGIIAGALACAVGRTFGGSKYQVYGPTAAFIPVIAALISKYGGGGATFDQAHGFLVLVSGIAGLVLMIFGMLGMGKHARHVPNSIIVGFTVGIAVTIGFTNLKDILGVKSLGALFSGSVGVNGFSLAVGFGTLILTKMLLRISIFIPGPVISIVASTVVASTVWKDRGLLLVRDLYGSIPNNFFKVTMPFLPPLTAGVLWDIFYFVGAIVFVSGVESVLCSSMADKLAENRRTPFNPDKEFFGQGLVQVVTPLIQGFPCTGALARTATSIKAGAKTPLAGYFKAILKLTMAYYLADYLELIPMACIGGILVWVSTNMIKAHEIREIWHSGKFEAAMMVYTAVMVPMTDFLTGVLSALIIYFVCKRVFLRSSGETQA
jgi:SulP family sulfate permease